MQYSICITLDKHSDDAILKLKHFSVHLFILTL